LKLGIFNKSLPTGPTKNIFKKYLGAPSLFEKTAVDPSRPLWVSAHGRPFFGRRVVGCSLRFDFNR